MPRCPCKSIFTAPDGFVLDNQSAALIGVGDSGGGHLGGEVVGGYLLGGNEGAVLAGEGLLIPEHRILSEAADELAGSRKP